MDWELMLGKLIELVENTAPHLWAIVVKQVYVRAAQHAFFLVVGAIGLVASSRGMIRALKKKVDRSMDVEMERILWGMAFLFAVCLVVATTPTIIGLLVNPEYYAIELLINYIK